MKNSEQPVHPCIMQQVGENDYRLHKDGDAREHRIPMKGLTKREYFVGIALRELIGESQYVNKVRYNKIAERAIELADEVLKQLGE